MPSEAEDLGRKFDRLEATIALRIPEIGELRLGLSGLNSKLDSVISRWDERDGKQNERLAALETRTGMIEEAALMYQKNHSGPGGDHDRQRSFNLWMAGIVISGAGIGATLAVYVFTHIH